MTLGHACKHKHNTKNHTPIPSCPYPCKTLPSPPGPCVRTVQTHHTRLTAGRAGGR